MQAKTQNTRRKDAPALARLEVSLNRAGEAPDWVELIPAGPRVDGRDGRRFLVSDPQAIVRHFTDYGQDLPFDYEHSTEFKAVNGDAAPAIGWITALDVRAGAVLGKVDWTDEGKRALQAREYRYLSPVLLYRETEDGEMNVVGLASAALTNSPNLRVRALNREQKETPMDLAHIRKALGLTDTADEAAILAGINALNDTARKATNRAEAAEKAVPSPADFIPVETLPRRRSTAPKRPRPNSPTTRPAGWMPRSRRR